jgi:hypothetical protein
LLKLWLLLSRLTSAYASFLSVVFWIRFCLVLVACFGIFAMCVVIEVVFGRRWCCCDWSQFLLLDVVPDVVGFLPWLMVFPVCLSWCPLAWFWMSKIVVRLWISVVDGVLVYSQESCLSVARPRFYSWLPGHRVYSMMSVGCWSFLRLSSCVVLQLMLAALCSVFSWRGVSPLAVGLLWVHTALCRLCVGIVMA